ncbi:VanZ family protein [Desulforhopalus sp. IMCC35007]|uniref:VanZ family protein n=1 Tax=Desulforhopalus sp. IMCC35007 TaxID=2569543 RepID=UPI0010ADDC6C|nr:VanZ family protein [Desulforhopalus sp. IMCC35007]TKB05775.1 hypothetical protein FCL48_23540 [Desulforhopalus sp. IMCC35007]
MSTLPVPGHSYESPLRRISSSKKCTSPLCLSLLYLSCALVTVSYVQLYAIYKYMREQLGVGFITWLPILSVVVAIPLFTYAIIRKSKSDPGAIRWGLVLFGAALAVIALFIPEPSLGAKRIHVTEYFLLSLLVRFTLSRNHSGGYLLFASCFFTIMCGVHDEFLQGLHPQRTYGLRDITVNAVSAIAGSCVWHGLHLFSTSYTQDSNRRENLLLPVCYYIWLLFAVILTITPISAFRLQILPLWIFLPLSASIVFYSSCYSYLNLELRHGIAAISWTTFLLLIYPVMTNVFQVSFY